MSLPVQPSLPLDLLQYHNNRGLFASHYLDHPERLKASESWNSIPDIRSIFQQIRQLYDSKASFFNTRTNEAQTENDFIRPVLNLLWGMDFYQVQTIIPNVEGNRQPDYAFFLSDIDRQDAQGKHGTSDFWQNAPVLGDAKKWTSSLDKEQGTKENPSAQVCNYLYRSRVRWGILTNGRIWRLYEREKSSAGGIYYEVDLEYLLKNNDPEAFKYFYLFFRRDAFIPDANGISFIDKIFQGSVDYATEVSDRLKESVYDALRLLMNGFFERKENKLDNHDPKILKLVHENCLIMLYRLLFVFYAEDRNLLPKKDKPYKDYSLYNIQKDINEHLRNNEPYLPISHRIWDALMNLFELIDNGYPDGGIPAYNGGLFNPSKYPHIAHTHQPSVIRWEIGDNYIAEVIDMLAYQREEWNNPGTRDIDYNTLDVQHLGSIYEGLLELQPYIANEPMIEASEDSKLLFRAASQVSDPRPIRGQTPRTIKEGEVYLVTNRGERKASGSYYTPKYIVDYIVANTVGRLAEEASKKVSEMRPEIDKNTKEITVKKRKSGNNPEQSVDKNIEEIDFLKRRLLEPYLSLKILDPAMGSGHFLVGAADFLSLAMATDPNLLPIEEADSEDSQAFYKRLIVERCLYGVDLNPLAVELAKLSLWLHTVSKNKALSFIDHHLRCGNSLVGARIENDLATLPPELDARGNVKEREAHQTLIGFTETLTNIHLRHFLNTFYEIMDTPSGDAVMEHKKDELYHSMDTARDKFRAVANCWLAPYFGVPITPEQYGRALNALKDKADIGWQDLTQEKWFQEAQLIAHEKQFFHWELEFPEAFFDVYGFKTKDKQGFDAVIGNPPYGALLDNITRKFAGYIYNSSGSTFDVFALFIEQGVSLTKSSKYVGDIIPSGWLTAREHFPLRNFILSQIVPMFIVHLPYDVFPDAYIDCIIWIGQSYPLNIPTYNEVLVKRFENREQIKRMPYYQEDYYKIDTLSWISDSQKLMITESQMGTWLGRWLFSEGFIPMEEIINIGRGITPYIEADPGEERETALGFFGSIGRYELQNGRFSKVIYDSSLAEYRSPEFFSDKRIIIRRIISRQHRIHAILATDNFVINKSYILAIPIGNEYDLGYVLAILNSKLLSRAFVSMSEIAKRDDFPQLDITTVREFPLRRIKFATPTGERARLLDDGKILYEHYLSNKDDSGIKEFVQQQLKLPPKRSDIIHDILALLAEQMLEMNKQKQTEIKGFLTWLERKMGASLDGLKNKTKLHDYHDYGFDDLLDVLNQNRRKLAIDLSTRIIQEEMDKEFKHSLSILSPLKQKIYATDKLIDHVIYKLYGLTEEEVDIIEDQMD